MAMGHNLCLHFWADELPCTTYVSVHQGYRVLIHSHISYTMYICIYMVVVGTYFVFLLILV